ncbi:MAG TPA: tRNA (adenosine(37)-N6)-threonylcarbamoyltransferase complex ATPase subunit type 1 TsaE [Candidatus Saccharimonadales bacterium]|nr:tRNA (adenosine(37)-N6)-threonylcarbamoyltransferase complex ATPase subunit type 1 TsaE [Candidatus Saccharimonadales bacterium]
MKEQEVSTKSAEETMKLAESIAAKFKGGEVLELASDLGGGKTTFVRGLAKGLGSQDQVRSPSFTLGNEYHSKRLTLHHFDFYRLEDPGIMRDELAEAITDPKSVVAVEWSGVVNDVLPATRLKVKIRATGPDRREIIFSCPESLEYLLEKT